MRNLIVDLTRQPLVHFLVLGAVLGVALQWFADSRPQQDEKTIRITATDLARLDAGWRSRWSRGPTPEELDGLVKAQIREIALYREARAREATDRGQWGHWDTIRARRPATYRRQDRLYALSYCGPCGGPTAVRPPSTAIV